MNLWIRSQDRECLLKTDIVMIEEITENEEYWIYAGHEMYDPYRVFGVYQSKERALEILDEIQSMLVESINLGELSINNKFTSRVYKMPKE